MSAKRKHRTPKDYLDYLKGGLRREDRHAFEQDLERDPFQQEAMEGFETLSPGQAEEDLLMLHARLQKRLNRRKRIAWYSVAATIASILVVGTIFINIYDFNPEARDEAVYHEKSAMPEEDAPAVEQLTAEKPLSEESEATVPARSESPADKKGVDSERSEDPAEFEEVFAADAGAVPEEDVQFVTEARAVDDAQALDELQVQEPDRDMAAAPEPMETEAEAAEPDAIVAVEAKSDRKLKRTESRRAQKAAPQVLQYKAVEMDEALPLLRGQVSGIVVSAEDMDPLPGASIYVKGTDSGLVADMQGRFSIPAGEEERTTVIASYVGMVTDEYQLTSGQENSLVMQPDMAALNEVVVVGYGVQKETHPTAAVQRVQVAEKSEYSVYAGAEPEGGISAYKMYVEKNIRFPAGDTLSKREVVVLKFTVERDGRLSGIETLRSPGEEFTDEAVRLLEEGPEWNPARDENGTTDDEVRMRIVFKR